MVENARFAPASRLAHDADASASRAPLLFNGLLALALALAPGHDEAHPDAEEEIIASRDEEQRENMQAVVLGIKALAESG